MEHVTTVRFMHAWNEWRPECSCGWVGSYVTAESRAALEADQHVRMNERSASTTPNGG